MSAVVHIIDVVKNYHLEGGVVRALRGVTLQVDQRSTLDIALEIGQSLCQEKVSTGTSTPLYHLPHRRTRTECYSVLRCETSRTFRLRIPWWDV